MVKMLTAKEAVETYFYSGATVTFGGFANGLMHPEAIMAALEQAGRAGRLRDLKVVFASGQGDSGERGLNHLAVDGLCEPLIGAHWGLAVRLGEMAMKNSFAAYNLPQGVIAQLFREIAQPPGHPHPCWAGDLCGPPRGGGKGQSGGAGRRRHR